MDKIWEHHFKYYDLFQNNFSRYRKTLEKHLKELERYDKILDTGAGSGNLTLELLKNGHSVVALDSNQLSLKLLKEKCTEHSKKLKIKNIDVQSIKIKDKNFDGISSMFVIPFVNDNKRYFNEVYKLLKNDGKFTISAWAPIKDSLSSLRRMLKKELEDKKLLPKYKEEWNFILKSSEEHSKTVIEGPSATKIKKLLKEVGFKNIVEHKNNPYGKYAYFITCSK